MGKVTQLLLLTWGFASGELLRAYKLVLILPCEECSFCSLKGCFAVIAMHS